ncbi:ABC transporter permease subunit [Faecalibacterium sp. PGM34]
MAKNIAASRQKKPGGLSDKVSDIVLVVICAAVMLIVAYPLYYVLVASFSDPYDVYAGKTFLLPSQFTLKGYQAVFADSALFSGFMNSIKYTVIGTIYSVVMIYLVAYPLSVKDMPGRKYISLFFVITMYFGGGLVPTYLIVKQTGLLGSMWALFLPGVVAVGNVIIVRNFFENNIPRELLEAAEIDGASKWTVFVKMVIPLSRSIMAVMVVYSMVACIYGLPAAEQMGTAGIGDDADYSIFTIPQFSMINKRWLDELGLEVPTTLDELHTALKAFKDNDMSAKVYGNAPGSTIPMSTGFDEWCWGQNIFYAGFGFTNWPNDVCNDLVLQKDGKCRFVCAEDNYRKAVTYFHDWYAEGLMDVEMFSQDTNQLLAKGAQGYLGVSTWWYIEELMGDYAKDYVFLPVLDGPDGTHNVTVRTGGGTNSGNLNVTNKCQSPANLLKFFDQWYDGETVMQLQYGPIGVFFTEQDANGKWKSITEEEAKAKYNKGAGELKSTYEVWGPKLILSEYYDEYFYMEDRAIERLTDLKDFWMPFVDDTTTYPIDCVFTSEELDTIDRYRADFENAVSEQEGLWLKDGGPSDSEWAAYLDTLTNSCGMDKLLAAYQSAYDRYKANA